MDGRHQCRINANWGPWQLFARGPLLTRDKDINYMHASESTLDSGTSGTASHSSPHDMLAVISSRYQYGPCLFFFVAEVMSNYLTTDGLKIFSLLPEALLRPEAVAFATWLIRHVHTRPCHRPCCAYICERTASVIIHHAVLKMVGQ